MSKYALITNGVVVNTIEAEAAYIPVISGDYDHVVQNDRAGPGWSYDAATGEFSPPNVSAPPTLTVSLSATEVAPGTTVTGTVEVRDESGTLVDISGTYHVPVFDVDGRKATMLKVVISGGQGTKDFSLSEEGIYTLRSDLIRPKPTAQMAVSPELIVTN